MAQKMSTFFNTSAPHICIVYSVYTQSLTFYKHFKVDSGETLFIYERFIALTDLAIYLVSFSFSWISSFSYFSFSSFSEI